MSDQAINLGIDPTADQLKKAFGHLLQNKVVHSVSCWTEENHDDPCDEVDYRKRARSEGPKLQQKMDKAIESI